MGQTETFGTAASAQQYHGIIPDTPSSHGLGLDSKLLIEKLDSQINALASAATNINSTLVHNDPDLPEQSCARHPHQ